MQGRIKGGRGSLPLRESTPHRTKGPPFSIILRRPILASPLLKVPKGALEWERALNKRGFLIKTYLSKSAMERDQ